MQIAVTTPTGHVGRPLVSALVRAGVRPRVLVRDPAGLEEAVREHVEVRTTDLADADAVTRATEGVTAWYVVCPSPVGPDPLAEYDAYATAACTAVRANAIAHTVLQSSVGAELRHGAGEIDGLGAAEVALEAAARDAGTAVTHLRCGFFHTNLLLQLDAVRSGTVPVVLPLDQPLAWVDPRDIAEVAAAVLLRGPVTGGGGAAAAGREVRAVHGPADLGWGEAMRVVSAATGHEVRALRVADDEMRETLLGAGLAPGVADGILGMSTGLRDGFVPEQPRSVATTTPTTLRSWAVEALAPALAR